MFISKSSFGDEKVEEDSSVVREEGRNARSILPPPPAACKSATPDGRSRLITSRGGSISKLHMCVDGSAGEKPSSVFDAEDASRRSPSFAVSLR